MLPKPQQQQMIDAANKVWALEMQLMEAKHQAILLQPRPPDTRVFYEEISEVALRTTHDMLDQELLSFVPAGTIGYAEEMEYSQDNGNLWIAFGYTDDLPAVWIDARFVEVYEVKKPDGLDVQD